MKKKDKEGKILMTINHLRCWKMFTKFVVDFIPFKERVQNMK